MNTLANAAAALALAAAAGCSAGVFRLGDAPPEQVPAALVIAGPRDDLRYGIADDEDPDTDGLQLTLRVDVRDEAVERVRLGIPALGEERDDIVEADLDGNRAAYFAAVTFAVADAQLDVLATALDDLEARAVLTTIADPAR